MHGDIQDLKEVSCHARIIVGVRLLNGPVFSISSQFGKMPLEFKIQNGVRSQLVFNGPVQILGFSVSLEKPLFEVVIVPLGLFEANNLRLQSLYVAGLFLKHGLEIDKFNLAES